MYDYKGNEILKLGGFFHSPTWVTNRNRIYLRKANNESIYLIDLSENKIKLFFSPDIQKYGREADDGGAMFNYPAVKYDKKNNTITAIFRRQGWDKERFNVIWLNYIITFNEDGEIVDEETVNER